MRDNCEECGNDAKLVDGKCEKCGKHPRRCKKCERIQRRGICPEEHFVIDTRRRIGKSFYDKLFPNQKLVFDNINKRKKDGR